MWWLARAVAEARRMLKEVTDEEERLLAERSTTSSNLSDHDAAAGRRRGVRGAGAVIGGMLSSALAAPLVRLNSVVERIAHGEQGRAWRSSSDELGQVSIAFNQMAQSIQDSLAKELAATNLLAPRSIRCWGWSAGPPPAT
jgi:methyl-accepting chemotaxis protein WspA